MVLQSRFRSACGIKKKPLDLSRIPCTVGHFRESDGVSTWGLSALHAAGPPSTHLRLCSAEKETARPVLCSLGVSAVCKSLLAVRSMKEVLGNTNPLSG